MKYRLSLFKRTFAYLLIALLATAQNIFAMEAQTEKESQESDVPTLFDICFESVWKRYGNELRAQVGYVVVAEINHEEKITALAMNNRFVATGSKEGLLKISDLNTGKCIRELEGHTDEISALAISVDGQFLVSGSADRTLKLWDVESGLCLQTCKAGYVKSIAISKDNTRIGIVTYTRAKLLKTKNLRSIFKTEIEREERHSEHGESLLYYSVNKDFVASKELIGVAINNKNELCYAVEGNTVVRIEEKREHKTRGPKGMAGGSYSTTHFRTKTEYFLEISGMTLNKQVQKSNKNIGKNYFCFQSSIFDNYRFADLNVDHEMLITADSTSMAYIRNFRNTKKIKVSTPGYVRSAAISADGSFMVTGHATQAVLWDVKTGNCLCILSAQKFERIGISPNGKYITGLDKKGAACIWKINLGEFHENFSEYMTRLQMGQSNKKCLIS